MMEVREGFLWPWLIYYLQKAECLPTKFLRRLLRAGLSELPCAPESFIYIIEKDLPAYLNLKDSLAALLRDQWTAHKDAAERLRSFSLKKGIACHILGESAYPEQLAFTEDAPLILFSRGQWDKLAQVPAALAVVGSRRMTPYSERFLEQELAKIIPAQAAIISGLARGCDTKAHTVCLKNGGFTISCLAHGPDLCYPPEHLPIMEEIAAQGLLLSEYAPGVKARRWQFPARNRIIAGLCDTCFVVEAGLNSGSLITADYAAAAGREVAVLTASVFALSSAGSNALLREGARPILNYQDLLDALGLNEENRPYGTACAEDLPPILKAISEEALSEMEISLRLNLPLTEVRIKLLNYEAKGQIRRFRGRVFLTRT